MTQKKPDVSVYAMYSMKATAELLGVHRNSLYNYIKQDKITFVRSRLNGRPLFKGKDIINLWQLAMAIR